MPVLRHVKRVVLGLIVLGIAVVSLLVFLPKWRSRGELLRIRAELEAENERLASETAEFIRKQQLFQSDPSFVERTAHESGRVKTDETVFVFPRE